MRPVFTVKKNIIVIVILQIAVDRSDYIFVPSNLIIYSLFTSNNYKNKLCLIKLQKLLNICFEFISKNY